MSYSWCQDCLHKENDPTPPKESNFKTDEFEKHPNSGFPGFVLRCPKCKSKNCYQMFLGYYNQGPQLLKGETMTANKLLEATVAAIVAAKIAYEKWERNTALLDTTAIEGDKLKEEFYRLEEEARKQVKWEIQQMGNYL